MGTQITIYDGLTNNQSFQSGSSTKVKTSISFNTNGEYIPLLKVFSRMYGNTEDYLVSLVNQHLTNTLKDLFNFNYLFNKQVFNTNMRDWRITSEHNRTIAILLLTIFGIQEQESACCSVLGNYQKSNVLVDNAIDIFTLPVIKISDISKIRVSHRSVIIEDSDIIKIFISKEKFKSPAYMQQYYNGTARKHLWTALNDFVYRNNVKTEVVSDAEISKYYNNPYSIKTNSLSEIMEIDRSVKDRIFEKMEFKVTQDE